MRNSCGIKCVWLKGCLLLEVGTGLLPLLTGRLFLTLSCNFIFFPIWWWGEVWIYVTVGLLFGWWPIVPSLEWTKVSLCKQEGEAGEGPLTRTLQPSTVHTLFSSCSLFRDSKRLYHLYKPCLREAQKGELIHKKVKQLQMHGQVSVQSVVEKATTLSSAERCGGKRLPT